MGPDRRREQGQRQRRVIARDPNLSPSGPLFENRCEPGRGTLGASRANGSSELIPSIRPQIREIASPGYPTLQRRTAREFFSASLGVLEKSHRYSGGRSSSMETASFASRRGTPTVASLVADILLPRDRWLSGSAKGGGKRRGEGMFSKEGHQTSGGLSLSIQNGYRVLRWKARRIIQPQNRNRRL